MCTPLNPSLRRIYLHAHIFIRENLFLLMIVCENLFLIMIICENVFLSRRMSSYQYVSIFICENLSLSIIISENLFFICNQVNNAWLKQKYYLLAIFFITTKISPKHKLRVLILLLEPF